MKKIEEAIAVVLLGLLLGTVINERADAQLIPGRIGGPFQMPWQAPNTPTDCSAPQYTFQGDLDTGVGYGGSNKVCIGGQLVAPDGSASAPTYSFASATGTGWYNLGAGGQLAAAVAGSYAGEFNGSGVGLASTGALLWRNSTGGSGSVDLLVARESAFHWFQRSSTNAQRASWANTYTSSTNYEAFSVDWQTTANVALVGTRTAATGTSRSAFFSSQAGSSVDRYTGLIANDTGVPLVRIGSFTSAATLQGRAVVGNLYTFEVSSTAPAGSVGVLAVLPVYNQTGGSTTANTDLLINRTQTAVGSGTQRLIDAQVGGVTQFNVRNDGLVTALNGYAITNRFVVNAAPTTPVACTSPTVVWSNGTAAFQIDVGTTCAGISTLVVTLPSATNAWSCTAMNVTTSATAAVEMTASTTTSATFTNYTRTTGAVLAWVDGADVRISCLGG